MQPGEEKQKRKIHRSPSYPAFDLNEAITKAKAVYENERRSATTAEVLASHMGYSAAVGPGGRAVSALRQYGLIEETSGKYRLSDIGYRLIHFDHDSDEWRTAVSDAARRPTLFRELLDEYPDGLPSDATLRNDLLRREFNPASIADVVTIFRNTMSLAESGDSVHNGTGEESTMQSTQSAPEVARSQSGGQSASRQAASQQQPRSYSFALSPDAKAELIFHGEITEEALTALRDYIDITVRVLAGLKKKPTD